MMVLELFGDAVKLEANSRKFVASKTLISDDGQ